MTNPEQHFIRLAVEDQRVAPAVHRLYEAIDQFEKEHEININVLKFKVMFDVVVGGFFIEALLEARTPERR